MKCVNVNAETLAYWSGVVWLFTENSSTVFFWNCVYKHNISNRLFPTSSDYSFLLLGLLHKIYVTGPWHSGIFFPKHVFQKVLPITSRRDRNHGEMSLLQGEFVFLDYLEGGKTLSAMLLFNSFPRSEAPFRKFSVKLACTCMHIQAHKLSKRNSSKKANFLTIFKVLYLIFLATMPLK